MGRVIQVPLKRILRMVNLVPQSISTFLGRRCRTTSHSQPARWVTACDERVCEFPVRIGNGRTSAKSHQGSFFCAGAADHTGVTLRVTRVFMSLAAPSVVSVWWSFRCLCPVELGGGRSG